MKFDEWLWNEYQKFAKIPGSRRVKSQAEFARYLGVTTGSLSRWLNGDNPPGYDNVIHLAQKLGAEIYSVTGFDPPKEMFADIPVDKLPTLFEVINDWRASIASKGITDINSPESVEIYNEALRSHGL